MLFLSESPDSLYLCRNEKITQLRNYKQELEQNQTCSNILRTVSIIQPEPLLGVSDGFKLKKIRKSKFALKSRTKKNTNKKKNIAALLYFCISFGLFYI